MKSGEEIRALRKELGLSQGWLAANSGLDERTVRRAENQETEDPNTLRQLEGALKDFDDLKQLIARCDESGLALSDTVSRLLPEDQGSAAKALASDMEKNKIDSEAGRLIYELAQRASVAQLDHLKALSIHLCGYLFRIPDQLTIAPGELLSIDSHQPWVLQIGLDKAGKKALSIDVVEGEEGAPEVAEPENAVPLQLPTSPRDSDLRQTIHKTVEQIARKGKYSNVVLPSPGDESFEAEYKKLKSQTQAGLRQSNRIPDKRLFGYEKNAQSADLAKAVYEEMEPRLTVNAASLPSSQSILSPGVSEEDVRTFIGLSLGEIYRRKQTLESHNHQQQGVPMSEQAAPASLVINGSVGQVFTQSGSGVQYNSAGEMHVSVDNVKALLQDLVNELEGQNDPELNAIKTEAETIAKGAEDPSVLKRVGKLAESVVKTAGQSDTVVKFGINLQKLWEKLQPTVESAL